MGVYRNLFHEAGRHRRLQTLGPARRICALIARNHYCPAKFFSRIITNTESVGYGEGRIFRFESFPAEYRGADASAAIADNEG
jgi:hypothetical protein